MLKLHKIFISFFTALFIAVQLCSTVNCSGVLTEIKTLNLNDCNEYIDSYSFADERNFYTFTCIGDRIEQFTSDISLSSASKDRYRLDGDIIHIDYFNGVFYILMQSKKLSDNGENMVFVAGVKRIEASMEYTVYNNVTVKSSNGGAAAFDKYGYVYCLDSANNRKLIILKNGVQSSITVKECIRGVKSSSDKSRIYIFADDKIYSVNAGENKTSEKIKNPVPFTSFNLLNDRYAVNNQGYVYDISNNWSYVMKAEPAYYYTVSGNYLFCGKNDTAFVFDLENKILCGEINPSSQIVNLAAVKNKLFVSVYKNKKVSLKLYEINNFSSGENLTRSVVSEDEYSSDINSAVNNLNPVTNQSLNSRSIPSDSIPDNSRENSRNNAVNMIFDEENSIIYNITNGTTVAEFKNSLSEGSKLSLFYDYRGKKKDSGQLGTGGRAVLNDGTSEKTYTLVVEGDITGEGNVKSNDVDKMFNVLLGSESVSGAYAFAADINHDGSIDIADLLRMQKIADKN